MFQEIVNNAQDNFCFVHLVANMHLHYCQLCINTLKVKKTKLLPLIKLNFIYFFKIYSVHKNQLNKLIHVMLVSIGTQVRKRAKEKLTSIVVECYSLFNTSTNRSYQYWNLMTFPNFGHAMYMRKQSKMTISIQFPVN